jgi:putative membrane protein
MTAPLTWLPHLLSWFICFGQAETASSVISWERFLWNLAQAIIYTIIGVALFGATYLIIDKVTPFSLRKELLEDKNQALAIVLGAVFLSIAIILAAAIH